MPINKEVLDFLISKFSDDAKYAVDVGAHTGEVSIALRDLGFSVWAVDIKLKLKDIYVEPIKGYIYPMGGHSSATAELFSNGILDVAFIDAGKTYNAVMGDLNAWAPKIRKGGIICGYDCEVKYGDKNPDTQALIDEYADQEEYDWPPLHCGIIKGVHDFFEGDYEHHKIYQAWWKYV